MKSAALVLWASLLFTYGAAAQSAGPTTGSSESEGTVISSSEVRFVLANQAAPTTFALAEPKMTPAPGPRLSAGGAASLPGNAFPGAHQPVYGVLQDLNFQIYGGFTYFRFYELPGVTGNLAGLNASLVYYPRAGHWGVDGEFAIGFASQNGSTTTLGMWMGGGRFRLAAARGFEVWAHALAGGAHFVPKTPYGSETAFAFEAGGGADWSPRGGPIAFRAQGDVLGTYFFGTHQYGPKISVGVVYKF